MIAAVAAGAVALAGRGGSDETNALVAAGCTTRKLPDQGAGHTETLPAGFKYNSTPATSGPHHPQWAVWNLYESPLDEINVVHNLEHGGMVVQYGDGVPEGTAAKLAEWYRDDPNGVLVAPRPSLGDRIALTAWTQLAMCPRFDEDALNEFRDAYRGQGPERFPLDVLQPGT